jgi:hypothetical protein
MGLWHGTLEDDVWSFSGPVPPGAVRVVIETDNDTTYAIPCDGKRWMLALGSGDLPGSLKIEAETIDGTPVVQEVFLLSQEHRGERTASRWRRRRVRRGWTTFGPGSR